MSGGFNIESIVASAALAVATGGIGAAVEAAAMSVMSSVMHSVIQQVGQQLGLPPAAISAATAAFDAASGNTGAVGSDVASTVQNVASQNNFTPTQTGQLQGQADKFKSAMLNLMMQNATAEAKKLEHEAGTTAKGKGTATGGSWLEKIAAALGQVADQQMNKMSDLATQISQQASASQSTANSVGTGDASSGQQIQANNESTQLGSLNSQFQAVSQQLSIIENVISTTLKSVGEAQSTVARKN